MDFCVTNSSYARLKQFNHSIRLAGEYYLYFNDKQYYRETYRYIMFFCGILWNQSPEALYAEYYDVNVLNGQFYAVIFDKQRQTLSVTTDFLEDFPVYYYHDTDNLIITTDYLSFSPNHFKINNEWFIKASNQQFIDTWLPSIEGVPRNKNVYFDDNITPISKVQRAGPARVLKFCLATNRMMCNFRYYMPEVEYPELFKVEKRYSYDEAFDIAQTALSNNLQKIASTYDEITLVCSNGIDSLTNLTYLQKHKNLNIVSYEFDFHSKLIDEGKTIRQLHNSLDIPCSLITFSKKDYVSATFDIFEKSKVPIRCVGLAIEAFISRNKEFKNTIVKGSFGDEVFWHGPGSAGAFALHHEGITEFSDLPEYLSNFYNHQPLYTSEIHFNMMKTLDFDSSIMSYYYYRHFSYLKEDRVISNKFILSPYIDYKLRSLLAQCDLETQQACLLNVQIQKDITDPKLLKYLAPHKSGMEEVIIFDLPFIHKNKVIDVLKNITKMGFTISQKYEDILVSILSKDTITVEAMKQLTLAFFINKWVTD